jgi:hypothetical protein
MACRCERASLHQGETGVKCNCGIRQQEYLACASDERGGASLAYCAEASALTSKEMRANGSFVPIIANVTSDVCAVPFWIHHFLIRQKEHVNSGIFELFNVLGLLSRVRCKVLMWSKLFGIHEDTGNNILRVLARCSGQILKQLSLYYRIALVISEKQQQFFTRCPSCSAPIVGKNPTRSSGDKTSDLRQARYSSIVFAIYKGSLQSIRWKQARKSQT